MAKKCKGNGKAKGFGCGNDLKFNERNGIKTYNSKYGLGLDCCYNKWFISDNPEAKKVFQKFVDQNKIKFRKEVKAKNRQEAKAKKEKLKTLGQLENEAKSVFQKFIRLRDKDLPCISCANKETNLWDGGHFYKAEIYSGLIFDERNVSKQCRRCNRFLGGNENNYRLGLIKRFGIDFVTELDADAIRLRDYKFERLQLIKIKKEYQQKINQLKQ